MWSKRPKWTTRKNTEGVTVAIPWSKDGRLRYLEIYNHVMEERELDKAKGEDSVEFKYMMQARAKLDKEAPDRKRRKIDKDEDDVEMPIHDMSGNLRVAEVVVV